MTKLQIKNKLIHKIKAVENTELLEEISRFLALEVEDKEILKVPAVVKKSILRGRRDIKEGKYLTGEKAEQEIEKWLRR